MKIYIIVVVMIILDIITGVCAAIYKGEFTSSNMRKGGFHKLAELVLLFMAFFFQYYASGSLPDEFNQFVNVVYAIPSYLIFMELSSVVENLTKMNDNLAGIFDSIFDPKNGDDWRGLEMNIVMKGIDVSHWQGNIDFEIVKKSGFDFVIIKAGGADAGYYKDSMFDVYYNAAKAAGLYVGAYYFTGRNFDSPTEGFKEADHFIKLLSGKQFDMPVYTDIEAVPIASGKTAITNAAVSFCREMEDNGYFIGIYASDISGFSERLDMSRIRSYTLWVARYNTAGPKYVSSYGMWQYGGSINYIHSPKVNGVSSNACDQNYCYIDFPSIIVSGGFNGYKKELDGENIVNVNDIANWDDNNGKFIVTASKGDQKALREFCDKFLLGVENYKEVN